MNQPDIVDRDQSLGPWLSAGLPDSEPPPRVWERILETRLDQERRRRRRNGRAAGGAMAAALAFAAIGLGGYWPGVDPADELMARARLLEERLMAYEQRYQRLDPMLQASVSAQQADLLTIDQALARAYAEGQSGEAVERLWQQRLELMGQMVSAYEAAPDEAI